MLRRERAEAILIGNMPLPITGEVHGLAALHRQRSDAGDGIIELAVQDKMLKKVWRYQFEDGFLV